MSRRMVANPEFEDVATAPDPAHRKYDTMEGITSQDTDQRYRTELKSVHASLVKIDGHPQALVRLGNGNSPDLLENAGI